MKRQMNKWLLSVVVVISAFGPTLASTQSNFWMEFAFFVPEGSYGDTATGCSVDPNAFMLGVNVTQTPYAPEGKHIVGEGRVVSAEGSPVPGEPGCVHETIVTFPEFDTATFTFEIAYLDRAPVVVDLGTVTWDGLTEYGRGAETTIFVLDPETIQSGAAIPFVPSEEEPIATTSAAGQVTIPLTETTFEPQHSDSPFPPPPTNDPLATNREVSCNNYDSWIWPQALFDRNPMHYATLDPDGNNIACEHLPIAGFSPAIWAETIPSDTTGVNVLSVVDGDTISVRYADGTIDTVRFIGMDAPVLNESIEHCGADESAAFLEWMLGQASDSVVYLEDDAIQRDEYGRRLAYVWFNVDGIAFPYQANAAMILSGWADSVATDPNVKYQENFANSASFSENRLTGAHLQCGGFSRAIDDAGPSEIQIEQARAMQPDQGQFQKFATESLSNTGPIVLPERTVDQQASSTNSGNPQHATPIIEGNGNIGGAEEPSAPPETEPNAGCEPSYPTLCVPYSWVAGDYNCPDIAQRNFRVYAPDTHHFDHDNDGVGCES